ncbi:hypothetical protein IFR05_011154 [Cadophora sp. M221]|nr:hypothetical protein IFR05_011154 [Cadophora sp. M221]
MALLEQVIRIRETTQPETHPDMLTTMSNLAGVLDRQGKYAEAEAMNRQTLEIKEEVLGKTHPSTLTSRLRSGYAKTVTKSVTVLVILSSTHYEDTEKISMAPALRMSEYHNPVSQILNPRY